MTKRFGFDHPEVSRDEATELCIYHLRIAAGLYQVVPDDGNKSVWQEIDRVCDDVEKPAVKKFVDCMLEIYEEMKADD